MPLLLAPLLTWVFRDVVVKFLVFAALFALVAFLVPKAVAYLGNFINPGGLTGAFSAIGPGVWFFLDFFQLGYGVPLVISAYVARFLIRRLPFIG
ncbi:MAG: DUF2523 family protein [Sulfuritalea sp.]|nr:DUF2523 family protein [Sulfuritalea sp.]